MKQLWTALLAMTCACGVHQVYGPQDSNITVKKGTRFEITLPSLATAGYSWHLDATPSLVVLKEKKSGTLPKNAPIGQSADEIFVFDAQNAGEETLQFSQYREWEGADKSAKQQHFTVKVTS